MTWDAESAAARRRRSRRARTARTSAASRSRAGAAASRRLGGHARTRSGLDSAWVARDRRRRAGRRPSAPPASARCPSASRATASATSTLLSLAAAAGGSTSPTPPTSTARPTSSSSARGRAGDAEPVTIASRADQFQPSVAAAGDDVHVTFLDRRLAAHVRRRVARVLGRSRARRGARSGSRTTPGTRRSARRTRPTGDLLGDHQALAADRCGALALAADPHLANACRATATSTAARAAPTVPQLFAWTSRPAVRIA